MRSVAFVCSTAVVLGNGRGSDGQRAGGEPEGRDTANAIGFPAAVLRARDQDAVMAVVTADHGELFGEEGFFGHGPVQHPKVTEVPFVEGLAP